MTILRRLLVTSRHLPVLLGLLCVASVPVRAQSNDDGSLYSRFGLGELQNFSSSQIQAMGGGGAALWSPCRTSVNCSYVNFGNPATWGHQALVRASAGFQFDRLETTDASNNTKRLSTGSLNAIQFGAPLRSNKLGIAFAFEPYSRVNYHVRNAGQLVTDPLLQVVSAYQISYEGTGGLQQVRGGIGYRITDVFSVGVSADMIFGIIEESQRTTFEDPNLVETNLATSTRFLGFAGTLGALFTQSGLFGNSDDLSIAASLTLPTSFEGDRALTLGESLDRDTLGTVVEGSVSLPLTAHFGVAYQAANRWTFIADARYEPWSQFESKLSFPGYSPDGSSQFRDRLRVSGGFEVLPAGNDLLETYLKRVAYRLGFYYDQAYVTPVEGVDINTLAVTGGFSLPALFPGTRLDVNLEVGIRGTTDQGLVRDTFYGVSATLNVGERWFVRRKLR